MRKITVSILVAVLLVSSVFVIKNTQNTNAYNEESETVVDLDTQKTFDEVYEEAESMQTEVKDQVDSMVQYGDGVKVQVKSKELERFIESDEVETQLEIKEDKQKEQGMTEIQEDKEKETATEARGEEVQAVAEAQAKAEAEARAVAEMQAEVMAEVQIQTTSQAENVVTEVSRCYIEDCGSDSGYWEITYSDGHVEYIED